MSFYELERELMARQTIIKGKYNEAVIFTNEVEDTAAKQVKTLCDMEFMKELKIRVMPDIHAGAGSTIGTTMTIKDKVVPNLVGVDIGCGMETIKIKNSSINMEKLDRLILDKIPSGFKVRNKPHEFIENIRLDNLKCLGREKFDINRANKSLGTLGGGNHFIEANKDEDDNIYMVIHSGSRNIGLQIAEFYQKLAYKNLNSMEKERIPRELAYLSGEEMDNYIHDMEIMQRFAEYNRKAMMEVIIEGMDLEVEESFTTIHNYIDAGSMILRKGAVSAKDGEKLLIPINMRDGSLICVGKGNEEWNYSAPHGAGRLMSRSVARKTFDLSSFKNEMKSVYSTSVNTRTIDECPMAYKSMDNIVNNIDETATIIHQIKPIYNFKG